MSRSTAGSKDILSTRQTPLKCHNTRRVSVGLIPSDLQPSGTA